MAAMSRARHPTRSASATAAALALALAACGDDDALTPDAGPPDAGAPDAGPPLPSWPRALPATSDLGAVRGLRVMRSIVHAHSPLSHDACDGEGFADGMLLDAPCLENLRASVCTLRLDALNLTDHAEHLYEVTHEAKFWKRPGDVEERTDAGELAAVRWDCGDGTNVLVTVGTENALMPVGLVRHPVDSTDQDVLAAAYRANGPDAVARFHDAGGLVFVAHTEGRALDELRTLGMDGVEIYNIHANVDPDIRVEFLGLGAADYLMNVLAFTSPTSRLAPDLAFLGFFEENQNDLDKWDTLLAEGLQVTGINGCDAHENTFPQLMRDGERVDSYRRMMRWATLHLRVPEPTLAAQREALDAGRGYVAFEVFGSPVGFDFHATSDGGATHEMGDVAPAGATLRVTRPSLSPDVPDAALALVSLRILKSEVGGAVEVAQGAGEALEFVATEPGVYRAEARIVPEHARPYLGRLADALVHDYAWIYANPIYVGATPR